MKEDFYRNLIDKLPSGYAYHRMIFSSDGEPCDYEFIDVNSMFEQFTGLKKENIIGKRVTDVLPGIKDEEFDWISFYGEVALTGIGKKIDKFVESIDKWYRVHVSSPEYGYFVTYFTDITGEKKEVAENLKTIIASSDMVFELDIDHNFKDVFVSDEAVLFAPKKFFLERNMKEVLPKTLYSPILECFEKAKSSLKKESVVYKSPVDDRWFKAEVSFLYDIESPRYIVSTRDITQEKMLEQSIDYERKKLTSIIEGTRIGTWEWNVQSGEATVNERWAEILGYDLDEILPITEETWYWLMNPSDRVESERLLNMHFRGESDYYSFEFRMRHKKGHWVWILDRGKVVSYTDDGKPLLMLGTHFDITEQKELELELRNERNLLKTTLLSIEEGVISVDVTGRVLILNHVAESLTGWSRAESLGSHYSDIFSVMSENSLSYDSLHVERVVESKCSMIIPGDTVLLSKDGSKYPVEGNIAPILDKEGLVNGAVITFQDISSRKAKQEEIVYLSYHDQLTGLYNRRFFEEEFDRLDTDRNLPISLIMIDVNGLKLTNDAFGHMAGDKLLVAVSQVLRDACRADDIISRIGGDEFAILLPHTSSVDAGKILERIYSYSAETSLDPLVVSVSAGYGTKSSSKESMHSAFKRAEDKMYNCKLSESKAMREKTLKKIVDIFFRDYSNAESHSRNVSKLSSRLGKALGLDSESIEQLETLGMFHDIGLISIKSEVVDKPEALTPKEWAQVKRHSEVGYQILKSLNHLVPVAEYVLCHHERWDGAGYPDGLTGSEIPLQSRIISLTDAYDAMTDSRPYRKKLSKAEAISELRKNSGTQFDPHLVDVFIEKVLKKRDS